MSNDILGVIFARGGSKGVPGKNIRPLAGKPLIAHAIDAALKSRLIDRVIVSTDDHRIARAAEAHGAEVPFIRPAALAGDHSPEWQAWQHAVREMEKREGKIGTFVSIPPTSPLREPSDIDACITKLMETDAEIVVTVREAETNPYFNMVVLDEKGRASVAIPPAEPLHRRQSAPPVYDLTAVAYATRPEYILRAGSVLEGRVRTVLIPPERALDIDTELDFLFAEFMMARRMETGGRD